MRIGIPGFITKSLKLLGEIYNSGKSIIVTKRGVPITKVVPISDHKNEIDLKGTIIKQGKNIFSTCKSWESNS
jgi:antitoxin (DNA-binding transcriptional repressor) of toxin-antitoxin stability system